MTNLFSKLFSNPFGSESTVKPDKDDIKSGTKTDAKSKHTTHHSHHTHKSTTKPSTTGKSGRDSAVDFTSTNKGLSSKASSKAKTTNKSSTSSGSTGSSSGSGSSSSSSKQSGVAKAPTGSRNFDSRYGDPFDRAKVLRLPGGPRGACCPPPCPPPWCRPPPPWGCQPPPPWRGCPPPVGPCFPPPPMPPGGPCFPPPFSPVCNFPPGGRQIIRVPRGCPPPFQPPCGGFGGSGQQPCYNNCNFYSASDNNPYPFNSCQSPYSMPYGGMMGGAMGDARPPFPFGDIMRSMPPLDGKTSAEGGCGLSSSEDFFKDLDVLANSSSNALDARRKRLEPSVKQSSVKNKTSTSGSTSGGSSPTNTKSSKTRK